MTYSLSDSIRVPATPEETYRLISDVTRTGEWSQQCHRCVWDTDERGVGATFTGHNRTPEREWQTTSTVVTAEPGREFAWSVGPGKAVWGFRLAPAGEEQTELTEYTVVGESVEAFFRDKYGDAAEAQLEDRRRHAVDGIPRTLEAIRSIARDRGRDRLTAGRTEPSGGRPRWIRAERVGRRSPTDPQGVRIDRSPVPEASSSSACGASARGRTVSISRSSGSRPARYSRASRGTSTRATLDP